MIDAGNELKLERWGSIITIRPERQAYFEPFENIQQWRRKAHLEFKEEHNQTGQWIRLTKEVPAQWTIHFDSLTFQLEPTAFKHVGLFPEQRTNWDFIRSELQEHQHFLNLFAYTGASSLAAKSVCASVTHVDSIAQLVDWSNTNQQLSGLQNIRWVVEDALLFAQREVKRGNTYDMIQMDPPAYGLGKKGKKWKLEDKIEELLFAAKELLNPDGWLILNTYSPKLSLTDLLVTTNKVFQTQPEIAHQLWLRTSHGNRIYTGDLIRIQKP